MLLRLVWAFSAYILHVRRNHPSYRRTKEIKNTLIVVWKGTIGTLPIHWIKILLLTLLLWKIACNFSFRFLFLFPDNKNLLVVFSDLGGNSLEQNYIEFTVLVNQNYGNICFQTGMAAFIIENLKSWTLKVTPTYYYYLDTIAQGIITFLVLRPVFDLLPAVTMWHVVNKACLNEGICWQLNAGLCMLRCRAFL